MSSRERSNSEDGEIRSRRSRSSKHKSKHRHSHKHKSKDIKKDHKSKDHKKHHKHSSKHHKDKHSRHRKSKRSSSHRDKRERRRDHKYKRKHSSSNSSRKRRSRSNSREEGAINESSRVKEEENSKDETGLVKQTSILTDELAIEPIIDEEDKLQQEAEERRKRIDAIMARHKSKSAEGEADAENRQFPLPQIDEEDKQEASSASSGRSIAKMEEKDVQLLRTLDEERERLNAMADSVIKIEQEEAKSQASLDMFDVDSEEDDHGDYIQEAIQRGFNVASQDINVDADGYYQPKVGEIIIPTNIENFQEVSESDKPPQYKIVCVAGKGVFSSVVKAENINVPENHPHRLVAIKMMRMRDIMMLSGTKEKEILAPLNKDDPNDKRFIIRMLQSFNYRKHLCIVFEYLQYNLREVLKKFGKSIGLSLAGVRMFTKQLFIALQYLRKQNIIHADLKPDNILVTEDCAKIKLCDFGTAFSVDERKITEYLASGYYRAPEVMIGCEYDTQIDVWAAAVSMYELYTGSVMFPGKSNTHMLKLIMEIKGRINSKMLKKGEFTDKHFDDNYLKSLPITPTKSLSQILTKKMSSGDDPELVNKFVDFLEKCLILDPKKRMTPENALLHPFLQ